MPLTQIFYKVYRLFIKNDTIARSCEIFTDSWEAEKRFYAIIASDIANAEITYNECFVRDNFGKIINGLDKVFDRRDFSEPEPAQNPPEEPAEEPSEEQTESDPSDE